VFVPSGAVFGLDNLKVARVAPLDRLVLRTTKHPRALGLSPEESRRCLFRGPATEAVRQFPKNINISAAIGLATGIEPDVELWADPDASSNRHEIEASGAFGSVSIRADNLPSPDNPATSYLAALSVLTLLKDLDDPLQVGT
jgi:aspartate dehydrogenase